MTGRAGLLMAAAGAAALLAFAKQAKAIEYEIIAERATSALLREDEPNSYSLRDRNEEPFASLEDCRQVIRSTRIESRLGVKGGWRLRCRPVDVPIERVVTR